VIRLNPQSGSIYVKLAETNFEDSLGFSKARLHEQWVLIHLRLLDLKFSEVPAARYRFSSLVRFLVAKSAFPRVGHSSRPQSSSKKKVELRRTGLNEKCSYLPRDLECHTYGGCASRLYWHATKSGFSRAEHLERCPARENLRHDVPRIVRGQTTDLIFFIATQSFNYGVGA
jgi:hypothetical protein